MDNVKYEYMKEDVRLSNYSVLPNEVYDIGLSSTAMILYAKLLNRAKLSVVNHYFDEHGWAYVIYTLEELAEELHKSISSIKANMRELVEAGLVEKKRSEISRANMIFVKVPISSTYGHDLVRQRFENGRMTGQKIDCYTGRKQPPRNTIHKSEYKTNYKYAEGESL